MRGPQFGTLDDHAWRRFVVESHCRFVQIQHQRLLVAFQSVDHFFAPAPHSLRLILLTRGCSKMGSGFPKNGAPVCKTGGRFLYPKLGSFGARTVKFLVTDAEATPKQGTENVPCFGGRVAQGLSFPSFSDRFPALMEALFWARGSSLSWDVPDPPHGVQHVRISLADTKSISPATMIRASARSNHPSQK